MPGTGLEAIPLAQKFSIRIQQFMIFLFGGWVCVKARGQVIKMKHREWAKCEIPQCYEIV